MPLPDTQDHNIIQTLCGCIHWMTSKGYRLATPKGNDKQLTTSRTSGSDLVLIE